MALASGAWVEVVATLGDSVAGCVEGVLAPQDLRIAAADGHGSHPAQHLAVLGVGNRQRPYLELAGRRKNQGTHLRWDVFSHGGPPCTRDQWVASDGRVSTIRPTRFPDSNRLVASWICSSG